MAHSRSRDRRTATPGAAAALLCTLLAVAAAPAAAERDTPFPPAWAAEIEARFFGDDGALAMDRFTAYRALLQQRHDEIEALLVAAYREEGRKDKWIAKRIPRKKIIALHRLLLGSDGRLGLLDQLWDETDPVRARQLASDILEIDRALEVEGEVPTSISIVGYLSWASIRHWVIDDRTDPRDAEREASNLWNPATGRFYDADDLRALTLAGGDVSRLDPAPGGGFWDAGAPIAHRSVRDMFYGGRTPMHRDRPAYFPQGRARLDAIRKSQTKPKFELEVRDGRSRISFKLKVGGEIHSEPTVNALLSTLGFNTDLTRYVRDFRLDLGDVDVDELRYEWRSYFENHRMHLRYDFDDYFVEGSDDEGRFLLVREGVL